LRSAYDGSAADRDLYKKEEWRLAERTRFLECLRQEQKSRLLEVGAGTGQDSLFFQQNGLSVVATDLSPQMIERCRMKGLEAHVMDLRGLSFPPESFDAAYAVNCLLHVPNADMDAVLEAIQTTLAPNALLYVGVYGGEDVEGVLADDWHQPKRFFSFRSNETLARMAKRYFEIVDFRVVPAGKRPFQALILRRPDKRVRTPREDAPK
ncbi:MAG TPA: class I SAM-dependent methyltransferase, partial [Polyangiaceae bacterium]|nr:class I SAM-dependent methyltransferase [Polyangiaceae bacterium]